VLAKPGNWRLRIAGAVDDLFGGDVSPWIYAVLRIGLAAIFLVRHSDWLRPWLFLEHYRWVRSLDFLWSTSEPPYLVSPLWPGLALGATATLWLVYARTALSLSLLMGVRPRESAALLAAVSYTVFASDRYHYFHHLHFLYLSIAWLSLCPLSDRWSLERPLRRTWAKLRGSPDDHFAPPPSSPIWPLQLFRAFVVSIYLGAGTSKLIGVWLQGDTLELLYRFGTIQGPAWEALHATFGFGGIAKLTCLTELGLPVLLLFRPTRRWAVVAGLGFHAIVDTSMAVSTFGAQMAVLLLSFLPDRKKK
jgi:hypothetical protein